MKSVYGCSKTGTNVKKVIMKRLFTDGRNADMRSEVHKEAGGNPLG